MRTLLSWIASSVLILVIPIYASYIYERIKAAGFLSAIKHVLIALILVSGVFVLGWYGLTPTTAATARKPPRLEYLGKDSLDQEKELRQQQHLLVVQAPTMQIMRTKFDDAQYAQTKNDFDRALKLYEEIDRGSDENGSFATFPCGCIKNNMAIASFHKQGDKGFKASRLLFEALRLEPKAQYEMDLIQRNVDALDHYINNQ